MLSLIETPADRFLSTVVLTSAVSTAVLTSAGPTATHLSTGTGSAHPTGNQTAPVAPSVTVPPESSAGTLKLSSGLALVVAVVCAALI
jgi:hypothetical protein